MKGFIFSTEAVFAAAAIILALGIFAQSSAMPAQQNKTIAIIGNAYEENALYFNTPAVNPSTTAKEEYCAKITAHNSLTKNLSEKNICRWE